MNSYPWHNKPVLRRLLEPKQFTSEAFTGVLKVYKVSTSMDGKGLARAWPDVSIIRAPI